MNNTATPASQKLFQSFIAQFPFLISGPAPASDGGEYIFELVVGAYLQARNLTADPWHVTDEQAAEIQNQLEKLDQEALSDVVTGLLRQSRN